MKSIKTAVAAAFLGLGGMANAATITDNDPLLQLGSEIASFTDSTMTLFGAIAIFSGPTPAFGDPTIGADNGSGSFILSYADGTTISPTITGTENTTFSNTNTFEILFDVTSGPAGQPDLVLFEFESASALPTSLPGFVGGDITLSYVTEVNTNVVPLPAGLPLLAAGLGGLALMRRRQTR